MVEDQQLAVRSLLPYSTPSRVLNFTSANTLLITKKNQCRMPMKTEPRTERERKKEKKRVRTKEHQTVGKIGENESFKWVFEYTT